MKLQDLNEAVKTPGEACRLAEEIDGRLVDGRMLLNQRDTATLLGITSRAFSDWPIEPVKQIARQKFFYWPDVLALHTKRIRAA